MIFVLILAGGTGSRMGAENPKQFLEIGIYSGNVYGQQQD